MCFDTHRPRVVVLLEGLDGSGKTTAAAEFARRLTSETLLRVETPAPAPGPAWFERFVRLLPASGETVIWDRSWYNRATVERVMGFSPPEDVEAFFLEVPHFEAALVARGFVLVKLWLDVDEATRATRLRARALSAIDRHSLEHPEQHRAAAAELLARTSTPAAPWLRVDASTPGAHRTTVDLVLNALRTARGGPAP